jgi:hypothetical protein
MGHKIKTFITLSHDAKRLFFEAWVMQLYAGLLLKFVPFKKIPALFPNPDGKDSKEKANMHPDSYRKWKTIWKHLQFLKTRHPSPAPGEGPGLEVASSVEGRGLGAELQLEELRSAVLLASRYTLWHNKCLIQSLAARQMLARRGISSQLSLGLRRNEHNKTEAHAWLKVDDIELVRKNGDYLELYTF